MENFGKEFRSFAKSHGVKDITFDRYNNQVNRQIQLLHSVQNNVDPKLEVPSNMTQYIIEERPGNFRAIDVFTRLINDRVIFMGMGVDDQIGNIIVAQLLFLSNTDNKKDITMYINSPGGSVFAGLAMLDTMNYIKPDVGTMCIGLAASMGAVLLAGGAKGKRFSLPHSRIMIHQVSSGMQGTSKDMEISLRNTLELKKDLYTILAKSTGKDFDTIEKDCDRDNWMRASEAVEYGLIDKVIEKA